MTENKKTKAFKKISVRKAGPVRLTAAACPQYPTKL